MPQFAEPRFFQQEADAVKFGALVTPVSVDWDADGDDDLVCGNTAGHIGWIENLDGGNPPKWAAPLLVEAGGEVIRIQAGPNGSIQGPCEAKWGYTVPNVADWDHDGLPDLIVNSIWGQVIWFRNVGTRQAPRLAAAEPIEVEWAGNPPKPAWTWWEPKHKSLVTQWRTTPAVIDHNHDELNDLVMLDHEGFLAFFQRDRQAGALVLLPPRRIFTDLHRRPLQLNPGVAGRSGRRKFCFADWDQDGMVDVLLNDRNVNLLRCTRENAVTGYRDLGGLGDQILAGHTTSPTVVDWDQNGVPDLLVGAEDGYLYYMPNPHPRPSER
jgi:hypothetical protein